MTMTNTEHSTNEGHVQYVIVQHTPDPFRRESRNVGVIVRNGQETAARFLGEYSDRVGSIDGRVARSAVHDVSLYRMWIRHWRRELIRGDWDITRSTKRSTGPFFRLIPAGDVSGAAGDSVERVCDFLYSLLVSDGGLRQALADSEEEQIGSNRSVREQVQGEFQKRRLMYSQNAARYPVTVDQHLNGKSAKGHEVSFFQSSLQAAIALEPLDLRVGRIERLSRGRICHVAHIFEDVKGTQLGNNQLETIALVRLPDKTLLGAPELIEYAMDNLLTVATGGVVDLANPTEAAKVFSRLEQYGFAA